MLFELHTILQCTSLQCAATLLMKVCNALHAVVHWIQQRLWHSTAVSQCIHAVIPAATQYHIAWFKQLHLLTKREHSLQSPHQLAAETPRSLLTGLSVNALVLQHFSCPRPHPYCAARPCALQIDDSGHSQSKWQDSSRQVLQSRQARPGCEADRP